MAAKKVVRIENWKIVDADEAGRGVQGQKFLVGNAVDHPNFPEVTAVPSSVITHSAAPTYVETLNTLYLLGEPAEKPLTPVQGQALAVIKKAAMYEIENNSDLIKPGSTLYQMAEGGASDASNRILRALIDAKLLVG